jgi:hypothetical protein
MGINMAKVQKRKYEKIDDEEIGLVIQCNDSHEFYERYRMAFPNKKKGIDSISKIWKRRSEFIKKQQGDTQASEIHTGSSSDFESFITEQNKILAELSGVLKEQLRVSKEILARLPKQNQKAEEPMPKSGEAKTPDHKDPEKKVTSGEKRKDIMIGS